MDLLLSESSRLQCVVRIDLQYPCGDPSCLCDVTVRGSALGVL